VKRYSRIFEHIIDYHNIRHAFLGAIRGNRKSPAVINFCRNTTKNLSTIREKLRSLACNWGGYRCFLITDPKLRLISTASIEQRIMHHAIIDPLIPIFERPMIYHTYACRAGKGTHAALRYAFGQCKTSPYFLKLDIRKYFDSIDHETLKAQLQRLIKDSRVMALLRGIIDSYETAPGKGVPIGNLTSQYFANLYLSGLDHFILEQLRPAGYCRYMDDFVLWASAQTELKTMLAAVDTYVREKLRLTVKQPVFGSSAKGLPFLGFLVKKEGIYLVAP
jgi:retron-type reverse transcriptase